MTAARVSLARLKQLAEAATVTDAWTKLDTWTRGSGPMREADAAFVVAANPATVAALCDALRELAQTMDREGYATTTMTILDEYGIEREDRRP